MENKYLAGIIIATVAVLIGLAFWSPIGNNIGTLAIIQQSNNASFTVPALNTVTDLGVCGQLNTSTVVIFNATGNVIIPAANYTVTQAAGSDGYVSARITFTGTQAGYDAAGTTAQVTCTYQPRGYITDGGGRAVALLIPVLFALAIALAASPDFRDWLKGVVTK